MLRFRFSYCGLCVCGLSAHSFLLLCMAALCQHNPPGAETKGREKAAAVSEQAPHQILRHQADPGCWRRSRSHSAMLAVSNRLDSLEYMVRRLAFPAPPPPPMVWSDTGGGGGLACAERGGGRWSCSWRNGQASQTRPA